MNKVLVNVETLTGTALNYAVAVVQGYSNLHSRADFGAYVEQWAMDPPRSEYGAVFLADLTYSTDWNLGGPIIDCEHISVEYEFTGGDPERSWLAVPAYDRSPNWCSGWDADELHSYGKTPLVAAMRCYVLFHKGPTVEIPEELVEDLPE